MLVRVRAGQTLLLALLLPVYFLCPVHLLLRKEVIQPQVPLRLPCYDFIPVTAHSLGRCLPCGWLTHFGNKRLP